MLKESTSEHRKTSIHKGPEDRNSVSGLLNSRYSRTFI